MASTVKPLAPQNDSEFNVKPTLPRPKRVVRFTYSPSSARRIASPWSRQYPYSTAISVPTQKCRTPMSRKRLASSAVLISARGWTPISKAVLKTFSSARGNFRHAALAGLADAHGVIGPSPLDHLDSFYREHGF